MEKEVIAKDSILYRGKVYKTGERFIITSQVLLKQYLDNGLVSLFDNERKISKKAEVEIDGAKVEVKTMSNVAPAAQPAKQGADKGATKANVVPKAKKTATAAKAKKPTTRKKSNANKLRKN